MRRKIMLALLLATFCLPGWAQEQVAFKRWHITPGVGINIPLRSMDNNVAADYLVSYQSGLSMYASVIDVAYSFEPHWGIFVNIQSLNAIMSSGRTSKFEKKIEEEYNAHYFLQEDGNYKIHSAENANINWNVGGFYQTEKNGLVYKCKLALGFVYYSVDTSIVYLKTMGTNHTDKLSFSPLAQHGPFLSVSPSFSVGYRLADRVVINLDCAYRYSFANIKYEIAYQDLYTLTSQFSSYHYPAMQSVSVGLSLGFELRRMTTAKPYTRIKR